jgi:glucose-1-phosphate adenylyltransferase
MHDVLTLILGGGRGARLYPLTKRRSEPAVPIGGKYRLIDIPISNCINSGLRRIYVLTQYLSVSLHRHIANAYNFDPFNHGFVEVLAAQQTNEGGDWYEGTADAIRQNIRYVREDGCKDVLVLAGDQLYRFNFRDLLQTHRQGGADVTIGLVPVSTEQGPNFGIARLDEAGRVSRLIEKPRTEEDLAVLRTPAAVLERLGVSPRGRDYLANMGFYLFKREALFDLLETAPPPTDLMLEVLPRTVAGQRIRGHVYDGYWEDVGTIAAYFRASLALASDNPPFDFHVPEGVIYTRMRNLPASRVLTSDVEQCLISDGCLVGPGTRLRRCVIGVRSRIGRNVSLTDVVMMGANEFEADLTGERRGLSPPAPPLGIGDDSVLERVIVDKNCRIGRGVRIINRHGLAADEGPGYVIREGIVILPNGAVVADGTVI